MEEVASWLEGNQDYQKGVDLYSIHGTNRTLLRSFQFGESPDNKKRLVSELARISSKPIPKPVKRVVKKSHAPKVVLVPKTKSRVNNTQKQKQFDFLLKRRRAKYGERAKLSNQLADIKSQRDRKMMVDQIKVFDQEIEQLNIKIMHFERNGTFPEELETTIVLPDDPLTLTEMRNSLRQKISKARKNIKMYQADPKKLEHYKDKEQRHIAELKPVVAKLGKLK